MQGGAEVPRSQGRKVGHDLGLGHPSCEVLQHVIGGYSGSLEAWLSAANARLNLNVVLYIHGDAFLPDQDGSNFLGMRCIKSREPAAEVVDQSVDRNPVLSHGVAVADGDGSVV